MNPFGKKPFIILGCPADRVAAAAVLPLALQQLSATGEIMKLITVKLAALLLLSPIQASATTLGELAQRCDNRNDAVDTTFCRAFIQGVVEGLLIWQDVRTTTGTGGKSICLPAGFSFDNPRDIDRMRDYFTRLLSDVPPIAYHNEAAQYVWGMVSRYYNCRK